MKTVWDVCGVVDQRIYIGLLQDCGIADDNMCILGWEHDALVEQNDPGNRWVEVEMAIVVHGSLMME